MPELPEVETIKLQLEKLIVGKKILGIDDGSLKEAIGAKITKIARRAKLIQIFLDNGKILVIHLKLTGRLLVREKSDPKDDWQRITISLAGGSELRFADLRKFGWLKLMADESELKKILGEFGPEATEINLKEFEKILAGSRRPVKVVLMDQKKISGIGNIYANDALNLARIDPRTSARELSSQAAGRLHGAILKVLRLGIKYGGASDQFYLDAKGKKGHYQEHFLVYNRQGERCFNCGSPIKKFFLAGRGTYFCEKCQK
jgi:formamidopyrimidine-DNA glycosylase